MGFFSKAPEATEAPNRSKREQCWDSRDIFFSCLDKIGVENALDKDKAVQENIKKQCGKEDIQFQKDCAKSWVMYFKEKRNTDIKKERFYKEMEEQGAQPLPFPISRRS